MSEPKTIGQRIKEARERRGISQEELAMRIGGDTKNIHVARWENGQKPIRASSVVKCIAALGCSWQEIYGA